MEIFIQQTCLLWQSLIFPIIIQQAPRGHKQCIKFFWRWRKRFSCSLWTPEWNIVNIISKTEGGMNVCISQNGIHCGDVWKYCWEQRSHCFLGAHGIPQPWYFPLSPYYWGFKRHQNNDIDVMLLDSSTTTSRNSRTETSKFKLPGYPLQSILS